MSPLLFLLLPAAAQQVDPAEFPWAASVDLSACADCSADARAGRGVLRVVVPPGLRSAGEPPDARDLALLDADGEPLDVAVLRGGGADSVFVPSRMMPTADADVYEVEIERRPADWLDVDLRSDRWAATVTVDERTPAGWVTVSGPTLCWEIDGDGMTRMDLGGRTGTFRVRLERHHPLRGWTPDFTAQAWDAPRVDPVRITLPVAQEALLEDGLVRYTIELPGPLPVTAVTPVVTGGGGADGAVFERAAGASAGVALRDELRPALTGRLRRVQLGGARVEDLRLPVDGAHGDTLVLVVDSEGKLPLEIPEVVVELAGLELLVRDPGPGPLTLLGGGEDLYGEGARAVSDLQAAAPELARMVEGSVVAGAVEPHGAYLPPEHRAGLAAPGAPATLSGMTWKAPVEGAAELVRIELSDEVLARSGAALHGLRLVAEVEGEQRQVPYLLRRRPLDRWRDDLAFTRSEDGAVSRLEVPLDEAGLVSDAGEVRLSRMRLHSDAPLFSRTVTLSRVRGAALDPLRTVTWQGGERPRTLALAVDRPVGATLVVEVDNGDDPPLPLTGVDVATPVWELVAWLPPGGATLYGGDPDLGPASYDLALLGETLERRALATASLGPVQTLRAAPVSAGERGLVLAGLATLVAGLGVLIVGLLRAVPEAAAATSETSETPDGDGEE